MSDNQNLESKYDDFLFAEVGEQENGMAISMASALTRLGLDPWDEAQRLSALPAKSAAAAVTNLIERVPDLPIVALKLPALSSRLVSLLARGRPSRSVPVGRLTWWETILRIDRQWLLVAVAAGGIAIVLRVMFSG